MTYEAAMSHVNSRLKRGVKAGLQRITELLDILGNPHEKLKCVHIAGTNGKGSTSALISSALTQAGYKTGLFTSPFVLSFSERFQIDRKLMPENELIDIVKQVDAAIGQMAADEITEFEFITAMAFLWFYQNGCDYVVLEVGLGGRLDSTNVIPVPKAAVITQIDIDHTEILGDTIEKIAFEKAGIIKENGRVVLYPIEPYSAEKVISDICRERHAELIKTDADAVDIKSASLNGTHFVYDGQELYTPFAGAHQILNAITAYTALKLLNIPQESIAQGFEKASMPARMEVISEKPFVMLDGGHNPGCAKALKKLLEDFTKGKKRTAVMGMMADKDVEQTVKILSPMFSKIIAAAPSQPRALSAGSFAKIAEKYCDNVVEADSVEDAVKNILKGEEEITVVCGSFYLVSEFRNAFKADTAEVI